MACTRWSSSRDHVDTWNVMNSNLTNQLKKDNFEIASSNNPSVILRDDGWKSLNEYPGQGVTAIHF